MLSKIVNSAVLKALLDDDVYYEGIGKYYLSASKLKDYFNTISPESKKGSTKAMEFGKLVHQSVLEPDKFEEQIQHVNHQDGLRLYQMKQSILSAASHILNDESYTFEKPFIGELEGVRCKCKADIIGPKGLYDIKTTSSLDNYNFLQYKWGYHIAAYHYYLLTGHWMKYIVVDKNTYQCKVIEPSRGFYDKGRIEWLQCIINYKKRKDMKWQYVGHNDVQDGLHWMDNIHYKVSNKKTYALLNKT